MKKMISLLTGMVLVLELILISGCGSDKFEGTWVGVRDASHNVSVIELNIKKNGEGYLVSTKKEQLNISPSYYGNTRTLQAVHFAKSDDETNLGAVAKDNVLTISSGPHWTFTYDESTKQLYGVLSYMVSNKVTFTRDEDGKLFDKTKDEVFAKEKDEMQQAYPDYTMQDVEGK